MEETEEIDSLDYLLLNNSEDSDDLADYLEEEDVVDMDEETEDGVETAAGGDKKSEAAGI